MPCACLNIFASLAKRAKIFVSKGAVWFASFFTELHAESWNHDITDALTFLQHSVLQLPLFLITLFKFLTPALDDM